MGRLHSTVEEVEALYFHKLPPKKRVDMTAAVRVGRTTVFVDAANRVYSTQVQEHCFYRFGTGLEETLEGCRRLGLVSKEAEAKHNAAVKAYWQARNRKAAASDLQFSAERLGLKLTKAQQRVVDEAQGVET